MTVPVCDSDRSIVVYQVRVPAQQRSWYEEQLVPATSRQEAGEHKTTALRVPKISSTQVRAHAASARASLRWYWLISFERPRLEVIAAAWSAVLVRLAYLMVCIAAGPFAPLVTPAPIR